MRTLLIVAGLVVSALGCGAPIFGCDATSCPSGEVCCPRGGYIAPGTATSHCLPPNRATGEDGGVLFPSGCAPEI